MTKSTLVVGFILAVVFAVNSCAANREGTAGTPPAASPGVPENRNSGAVDQQSVKSIVLENERKIWEAFKARNANAVSGLLADDLQVVTVEGRFDKAGFLRLIPQLPEIPSYTISNETVISTSKDVAVLTYDSK